MELELNIIKKAKGYRAGKLLINGKFFGYTIEDEDRGLIQSMTEEEIAKIKKHSITAIPIGRYEIIWSYSNRFKRRMMQLLNVPGFEGIRIHVANNAMDVEGCIGVAYEDSSDGFAGISAKAIKDLEAIVLKASEKEKVYITIK